ncbi:phosphatidylserine decarboxylase family protein [Coccidioides immitis RMSCC 3703]|uniref:Phosphatidylserine decarboxylase family protein n=2 Tax=Coccidioides immitis TaxID=5501 RepID=A0A0J8QT76_COCIT|nr:phosphatidylserine decarboxylase family protein [Coccidioides immitis RMSCC 2394]KMU75656.1 phosphatidylserine decarboxylase family protein [Coccidioides immitis RMSCC 3703]
MNPQQKASQFEHGTIFQAFLNTGGYHRWHGPVDVVIKQGRHSSGAYCSGIRPHAASDPSVPGNTQHLVASMAIRALIFIKAKIIVVGVDVIQLSNHGSRGLGVGKLGGTTIRGAG